MFLNLAESLSKELENLILWSRPNCFKMETLVVGDTPKDCVILQSDSKMKAAFGLISTWS